MFDGYVENVYISDLTYLDKYVTGISSIYTIHRENKELPYTTSAQGKNLNQLMKKLYSELSERIGFGCYSFMNKNTHILNLNNLEVKNCSTNKLGLGQNAILGSMDTTGTAAGNKSKKVVKKAVFELLEKNELYLFWYLNNGTRLEINKPIELFLKRQGMDKFENYFFEVQSLSIYPTIIYIAILNNHIVATGISCANYKYEALKNAIAEAKVVYMFNLRRGTFFLDFSEDKHKQACDFVRNNNFINNYLKARKIVKHSLLNFKLSCEIENLSVYLNCFFNAEKSPKIVSAVSTTLLKCTPFKENIMMSKSNIFFKRHPCPELASHVDCIVV